MAAHRFKSGGLDRYRRGAEPKIHAEHGIGGQGSRGPCGEGRSMKTLQMGQFEPGHAERQARAVLGEGTHFTMNKLEN